MGHESSCSGCQHQLNRRGEGTEVEQVSLWLDPVGKLLPRWGGFERTLPDNLQTLVSDKSPVWDRSESEHVSLRFESTELQLFTCEAFLKAAAPFFTTLRTHQDLYSGLQLAVTFIIRSLNHCSSCTVKTHKHSHNNAPYTRIYSDNI